MSLWCSCNPPETFARVARSPLSGQRGRVTISESVRLSETVDCDSINAEFRDGVLAIEFQKKPEAVPAKIAIKHGGDAKKLESKKS